MSEGERAEDKRRSLDSEDISRIFFVTAGDKSVSAKRNFPIKPNSYIITKTQDKKGPFKHDAVLLLR